MSTLPFKEPSAKTINVYRNPWAPILEAGAKQHTATSISWLPDGEGPTKIAVAYSSLEFRGSTVDDTM